MKRVKIPLGLANIKMNHTVEGWRCKECDRFYGKEEIVKGVCKYCKKLSAAMNKRNEI